MCMYIYNSMIHDVVGRHNTAVWRSQAGAIEGLWVGTVPGVFNMHILYNMHILNMRTAAPVRSSPQWQWQLCRKHLVTTCTHNFMIYVERNQRCLPLGRWCSPCCVQPCCSCSHTVLPRPASSGAWSYSAFVRVMMQYDYYLLVWLHPSGSGSRRAW